MKIFLTMEDELLLVEDYPVNSSASFCPASPPVASSTIAGSTESNMVYEVEAPNDLEGNVSIGDISFSNLHDFDIDAEDFPNLLDFCVNQQNVAVDESVASPNSVGSSPSLPAPRACSTIARSPIPTSVKRKRARDASELKNMMTGSWLKDVVANPDLGIFGVLQIHRSKENFHY